MVDILQIVSYFGAFGLGIITTLFVIKINKYENRLKIVENVIKNFPSPEAMAKKILTMKLPVSELPPEMIEELRKETLKTINKTKLEKNYIG